MNTQKRCPKCTAILLAKRDECCACGYNLVPEAARKRHGLVRSSAWLCEMEAAYRSTLKAEIACADEKYGAEREIVLEAQMAVEKAVWTLRGLSHNS